MSARPAGPSLARTLAYAAPAFALAVVGIPVYVYLPKFYTDVVGVPIAVVGNLLLAARIFDAVIDPPFGALSDRTRTRLGRRRPWILFGALPLALSVVAIFAPPETDPATATLWFATSLFALFLFWTVIVVPYEALGPELTFDFHERTRVLGLRDGMLIAGTLFAAASPAIAEALGGLPEGAAGERARFVRVAWLYAPLLVLSCVWCALAVREPASSPPLAGRTGPGGGAMLRNRPFLILLASYTVSAFGSNLPATLILFYVEYVLGAARAEPYLLAYFATGIACLPAWVALSRRRGKKTAWLASMALNTGAFAGVFFLGPGDLAAYAVLVVLSGVGFGATLAIPSSMQADVIDYDELLSGARREGRYVGVWSVARKLAAAAGVGASLAILGAAGYRPNEPQSTDVVFTLRVLYAAVPCLCNAAAIAIALAYPIDRAAHGRILAAIEQRRRGVAAGDPLAAAPLPGTAG
jgi:GPH family glycoside/pentoside/hexuronide:cation symporter